jgi:hypothetical protein
MRFHQKSYWTRRNTAGITGLSGKPIAVTCCPVSRLRATACVAFDRREAALCGAPLLVREYVEAILMLWTRKVESQRRHYEEGEEAARA